MPSPTAKTAPAGKPTPPAPSALMNEYARRYSNVPMRRAEAIVDFFFDLFEGTADRLRGRSGAARH